MAYPALVALGMPPVLANITSTAGLLPGYAGSVVGYRRELRQQRRLAGQLLVAGVVGGILGALLLLVTPDHVFVNVVPVLVFLACALLAMQPRVASWLKSRRGVAAGSLILPFTSTVFCAGYGSFFGAGLGVVLLGTLGAVLVADIQAINALKAAVSLLANGAGLAIFVIGSSVAWTAAAMLAIGAFLGGRAGSAIARRMSAGTLRSVVLAFGLVVAIIMAVRTYL